MQSVSEWQKSLSEVIHRHPTGLLLSELGQHCSRPTGTKLKLIDVVREIDNVQIIDGIVKPVNAEISFTIDRTPSVPVPETSKSGSTFQVPVITKKNDNIAAITESGPLQDRSDPDNVLVWQNSLINIVYRHPTGISLADLGQQCIRPTGVKRKLADTICELGNVEVIDGIARPINVHKLSRTTTTTSDGAVVAVVDNGSAVSRSRHSTDNSSSASTLEHTDNGDPTGWIRKIFAKVSASPHGLLLNAVGNQFPRPPHVKGRLVVLLNNTPGLRVIEDTVFAENHKEYWSAAPTVVTTTPSYATNSYATNSYATTSYNPEADTPAPPVKLHGSNSGGNGGNGGNSGSFLTFLSSELHRLHYIPDTVSTINSTGINIPTTPTTNIPSTTTIESSSSSSNSAGKIGIVEKPSVVIATQDSVSDIKAATSHSGGSSANLSGNATGRGVIHDCGSLNDEERAKEKALEQERAKEKARQEMMRKKAKREQENAAVAVTNNTSVTAATTAAATAKTVDIGTGTYSSAAAISGAAAAISTPTHATGVSALPATTTAAATAALVPAAVAANGTNRTTTTTTTTAAASNNSVAKAKAAKAAATASTAHTSAATSNSSRSSSGKGTTAITVLPSIDIASSSSSVCDGRDGEKGKHSHSQAEESGWRNLLERSVVFKEVVLDTGASPEKGMQLPQVNNNSDVKNELIRSSLDIVSRVAIAATCKESGSSVFGLVVSGWLCAKSRTDSNATANLLCICEAISLHLNSPKTFLGTTNTCYCVTDFIAWDFHFKGNVRSEEKELTDGDCNYCDDGAFDIRSPCRTIPLGSRTLSVGSTPPLDHHHGYVHANVRFTRKSFRDNISCSVEIPDLPSNKGVESIEITVHLLTLHAFGDPLETPIWTMSKVFTDCSQDNPCFGWDEFATSATWDKYAYSMMLSDSSISSSDEVHIPLVVSALVLCKFIVCDPHS